MDKNFWMRVEELLSIKGISKKKFAEKVGIHVTCIEKGHKFNSMPAADTAVRIAKFLDTSVEYLTTGDDDYIFRDMGDELYNFYRYRFVFKNLFSLPEETQASIISLIKQISSM